MRSAAERERRVEPESRRRRGKEQPIVKAVGSFRFLRRFGAEARPRATGGAGHPAGQRPVRPLPKLGDGEVSAPVPAAVVPVSVPRRDPAEQKTAAPIRPGFGRVESPPVKAVVRRHKPWAGQAFRHDVARLIPVGIFRIDQIPPVADLKEIGAFVRMEQLRRPDILGLAP